MMENASRENDGIRLPATNGPRPHRCEICQRSFREVATLRKHEQLHRADRPYICTTCNKSFLWSSNLKVHERVHTGERPYKCKICHRCFTQSNDLRRHERNVHMRGKLYSYKTPVVRQSPPNTGHMNLAAYQAFALQQRALLQHAMAYETMMQNATSVTSPVYLPPSDRGHTSLPHLKTDVTVSTSDVSVTNQHSLPHIPLSRDLKLEQVTPPPHVSEHYSRSNDPSISGPDDRYLHSPVRSGFSPSSSKSPPRLSSTTYGLQNGHRSSLESPQNKDDRPPSVPNAAHTDYRKFYPYHDESHRNLPHSQTAYSHDHTAHSADSIMDLRVNKSISSLESEDGDLDWKLQNSSSKTPDSESECESKRDVTTTSHTPPAVSGVHHCPHCNIVFHDFTMYNLHQSLHSPIDEDPFLCPSCLKHCQDRVEFMFHLVWHVKYPHTIPKYQSFKESYLTTETCEEA